MGLLEKAYITYENLKANVGVETEGEETLCPISHIMANAQIEIHIDSNGRFISASSVDKTNARTIIPVTLESGSRTSAAYKSPHPLLDQIMFLADYSQSFEYYIDGLTKWAESPYTHPKVNAILKYVSGRTILKDLESEGVIKLTADNKPDKGGINRIDYEKCLVRFAVIGEGEYPETWRDISLFNKYIDYYSSLREASGTPELCQISWMKELPTENHPKGIVTFANGAKLISANDSSGFTYRGRFTEPSQAATIGYTASQAAHSALRWLVSNHSVAIGGRVFLWWNPRLIDVEMPLDNLFGTASNDNAEFQSFKAELFDTLSGYRNRMKPEDDIVVASLEAATTGRLSVVYYSELKAKDFMERIEKWYHSICYNEKGNSPTLKQIALCAFGNERGAFLELDDKLLRECIGRLLSCVVDSRPLPSDIVEALVKRFAHPQGYKNWYGLVSLTAFSVVRKYRNDRYKEEWTLGLDRNETDRSYLYGRLLSIADSLERSAISADDKRETNAEKLHSVYARRPAYAWRIIDEKLDPYRKKLRRDKPGLLKWFENQIADIIDKFDPNDATLNDPLDSRYIIGYYHQRRAGNTSAGLEENEKENEE